jgi:hypothetical protein
MRRNFEWRVEDRGKKCIILGQSSKRRIVLEIRLSDSIKGNVFNVTNSFGLFTVFWPNVPVSLGRCSCGCIHSFRWSTASLTRSSFRPNSILTLSSTPSLGGSITFSEISYVMTKMYSSQYHVTVYTGLLSKTGHYHRIGSVYFQGHIIQVWGPNSKSPLRWKTEAIMFQNLYCYNICFDFLLFLNLVHENCKLSAYVWKISKMSCSWSFFF